MKKKHKLFELLVVGGGLWVATGCGGQIDTPAPAPQGNTPTVTRTLADGGVPDGGDAPDPGGGSGFW